ncbi:family 16 glycosylhydrolase [Flavobacterium sp. W22_SRS_FP1]|uniref:family 16 glycosylhydrolase n=1 Tax=Flavobacterium sp. W22_SRS_FP1 TaxID=3240276 RepID=UPI003F93B7CA
MQKNTLLKILFSFLFFSQMGYSQVDVVYNDLVWSDEFGTDGAVNPNNWFHQTQIPEGGSWYNNEIQHYTNLLTNSFVDAGSLNIVAKKESFTDQGVTKQYTSARLNSKFAFKYGRVDIRAKAPNGSGTWPALWLLGKNINEDGGYFDATYGNKNWPACGELDIMEHGIFTDKPKNYIGSAIHTTSSSGNTVNKGGIQASDIEQNYHVYSMNWSPNQISFLLDDVLYYTYNPSVKNASTWPFDQEQYLLLNIAMGGFAGTIPSNFTETSMVIDYVRVYQNTTVDTEAPTSFTATVGKVSGSAVELLLNALDNSGNITYTATYGSGTSVTFSPSGASKSFLISGLSPNTNYTFSVSATDATGNSAVNNPIVLNAKTTEIFECSGTDSEASEGLFSQGYKYAFETIGTDVKITFELLDTDKIGVVAYLRKQTPFSETQMTNVSGKIFTQTITGQTTGSTINYAVKFAFEGGLSVTKYFSYLVGNSCSLGVETSSELKQFYFPNPVEDKLYLELLDEENHIVLTDILGQKLFEDEVKSFHTIDMSAFKTGLYFLRVKNSLGTQNFKISKK